MEKNVKMLICHLVRGIIKKWGRARFYLSCNYSYTRYFLMKILLTKLSNIYTSACLNLNYGTAKQKSMTWKVQR